MTTAKQDLIVYLDNLQRLIMANRIATTDTTITIQNPLILHITTQNNQVNIQFFPVIMREFLADVEAPTTWVVQKNNITLAENVILNARLISQYANIFAPPKHQLPMISGQPQTTPTQLPQAQKTVNNSPVIQLFDK